MGSFPARAPGQNLRCALRAPLRFWPSTPSLVGHPDLTQKTGQTWSGCWAARRPPRCGASPGEACSPVRRINSLIDTPRTKCSRRSSAQRSTSSTTLLPVSTTTIEPGLHTTPNASATAQGGSILNRRRGGVNFSPAPTPLEFPHTRQHDRAALRSTLREQNAPGAARPSAPLQRPPKTSTSALGQEAGHRASRAARLPARQGHLDDELRRLERYPLLVCDEVGYIPFDPNAAI